MIHMALFLFSTPLKKGIQSDSTQNIDYVGMLRDLIFATIFIVVMIFIIIKLIKLVSKKAAVFKHEGNSKILDVIQLGTNFKIIVIELNERVYIIADNGNAIEMIDSFDKEKYKISEFRDERVGFRKYLDQSLLKKRKIKGDADEKN